VFGSVEIESGRTFLVPVRDRTADTLMAILRDWIEPGTTVISDWWGAYHNLDSQGYRRHTVNHSMYFLDPETGAHSNRIESTWNHVEFFLSPYNRGEDSEFLLAHCLFQKRCLAEGVSTFI
jgi:transposase-like protein